MMLAPGRMMGAPSGNPTHAGCNPSRPIRWEAVRSHIVQRFDGGDITKSCAKDDLQNFLLIRKTRRDLVQFVLFTSHSRGGNCIPTCLPGLGKETGIRIHGKASKAICDILNLHTCCQQTSPFMSQNKMRLKFMLQYLQIDAFPVSRPCAANPIRRRLC
jgi:hypothetical protein